MISGRLSGKTSLRREPPWVVQWHPIRPDHRLHLARCTSKIRYQIDGTPVSPRTLRERGVPGDLPRPAPIRVRDPKNRSLALCSRYQGYPCQKRGSTGYDEYKKVNENKLSVLVDRNGLPLACTVSPANVHDSRIYEPTLEGFEIFGTEGQPMIILADAAYDAREIRQYNRKRGIKSNIPMNKRSRRQPKRGRPFWFDPELYKKRSAVERFFSWIEAFKKIVPRYERYEHSFMGLIHLACSVMIARILG